MKSSPPNLGGMGLQGRAILWQNRQAGGLVVEQLGVLGKDEMIISALRKTGSFRSKAQRVAVGPISTGEIQKGTGGRGRDRKCHKLS